MAAYKFRSRYTPKPQKKGAERRVHRTLLNYYRFLFFLVSPQSKRCARTRGFGRLKRHSYTARDAGRWLHTIHAHISFFILSLSVPVLEEVDIFKFQPRRTRVVYTLRLAAQPESKKKWCDTTVKVAKEIKLMRA